MGVIWGGETLYDIVIDTQSLPVSLSNLHIAGNEENQMGKKIFCTGTKCSYSYILIP